jgi:CheY-like chemotaxis protein
MDGLTAVREIRKAEKAGTLERNIVIALTGNARQGQIDQAKEAGMDDGKSYLSRGNQLNPSVMIKPYVLSVLLKQIKAVDAKRLELDLTAALDRI